MNLSDFNAMSVGRRSQPSDKELLMNLPKSSSGLPREERGSSALGGGFKDYGGNRQQGGECASADGSWKICSMDNCGSWSLYFCDALSFQ